MLFFVYELLIDSYHKLNILHYISFRGIVAFVFSFVLSICAFPSFIRLLGQHVVQPIRKDGPDHHDKDRTPTMGGVVIILTTLLSILISANLTNKYVYMSMFTLVGFGLLGFVDDVLKVWHSNSRGVPGKVKLLIQFMLSFFIIFVINIDASEWFSGALIFPIFKHLVFNAGLFYTIFRTIVITGSSNAINLTDGLDGLVAIPIVVNAACLAVFAYVVGSTHYSDYLFFTTIAGAAELVVPICALIGSCLGFLWFNAKPAQIFMGDVGSLALGAFLGTVAIMIKCELVFGLISGLFIIEALSVIIQVYYFRFTGGKRLFRMAPIHHHFEKCGWSETQVVVRFWIISILFAIAGMMTLKLR